ncbi:DUF1428 domain-containing protein [Pseudoroseomonas globiformis]|uniref:DUF1428 domain-containing protein n=1 Tax=Teichococcus globiformis TaxID=2307229 RepID=A0ABV7G888_9PROT
MTYLDGFIVAVPRANKNIYLRHASEAASLFHDFGASRLVEAWGDDVPEGQLTDFRRAVLAKPEEDIVFSWIAYPDRERRDQAGVRIMQDARMKAMAEAMPFDGKRMIYGGFKEIWQSGPGGTMGYVDGSLVPVPRNNRQAYLESMAAVTEVFLEHGATRIVEAWGDDVPDGTLTDFRRAVLARPEESVVFSWIEWPSRAARDAAWPRMMADPRMQPSSNRPFDGKRMVFGGFAPLLDTAPG